MKFNFLLGATLAVSFSTAVSQAAIPARGETVVLVHGLGRTSASMWPLAWRLKRAGYQVINLHYPSRRYTVEQLSDEYLAKAVDDAARSGASQIHFVTHSLGGILVRQYLATHTLTSLGGVVMLAPPNHGSKLADHLKKSAMGRWILGPAGCELGTSLNDLPAQLGPANFRLGIISASHDGKVPLDSTRLDGMTDFRVVSGFHTWIMCRSETSRSIVSFLKKGCFSN